MQNLELKVRCGDAELLTDLAVRAVAGGATFVGVIDQHDTYFAASHGRLKLREWTHADAGEAAAWPGSAAPRRAAADRHEGAPAGAVLIAYARPDDAGSRLSDYLLAPVGAPGLLREALARTLGVRVVVAKRRALYRYGNTRVHFDAVAGLGAFVELETVLAGDRPDRSPLPSSAVAEHDAVVALLGLATLPVVAGSYSDLLAEVGSRAGSLERASLGRQQRAAIADHGRVPGVWYSGGEDRLPSARSGWSDEDRG